MREEAAWLEGFLQDRELECSAVHNMGGGGGHEEQTQRTQQQQRAGRRFGIAECLCHNDLLSGNILLRNHKLVEAEEAHRIAAEGRKGREQREGEIEEESKVVVHIIDYEYAAYNYRAFDIANHFSGKLVYASTTIMYFI